MQQVVNDTIADHKFDIRGARENFDATYAFAEFGELSQFYISFGDVEMGVASSEEDMDGLSVFLLTSGTVLAHHGNAEIDLSPKRGLIRDLTKPIHAREQNFSAIGINLPRAKLRQQACALIGPEAQALDLSFDNSFELTTPSGQVFSNTMMYVNSVLDNPSSLHLNPMIAKQLEDLILTQALVQLPNSCGDLISGAPTSGAVPYYVKRARDHIHSHVSEPITLTDLTTVAGCGYRTLQVAFNEAYDMPPMSYLRRFRRDSCCRERGFQHKLYVLQKYEL